MSNLTAYKITCENGHTWKTEMAAHVTLKDASDYFIGNWFNTAAYPDEVMSKAIAVEQLAGPMKTYRVRFKGRTRGAIGIFYWISDTVTAENEEAANLKLYDKYEHIHFLKLEEI